MGLKIFSHDRQYIHLEFYITACLVIINFIYVAIFLIFKTAINPNNFDNNDTIQYLNDIFSVMRVIRPFYLIHRSRDLRVLSMSLVRAVSQLFQWTVMIIVFWIVFASMGYALFWEEYEEVVIAGKNEYFSSFGKAWWSLLVLQTTANFPDIMLQNYTHSQFVAFYYLIYNLFGIYFLMSLVFSVIYDHYKSHVDEQAIKIQQRKTAAKAFAFSQLIQQKKAQESIVKIQQRQEQHQKKKRNTNNVKIESKKKKDQVDEDLIFFQQFRQVCTIIRPDFKDANAERRLVEKYCQFTGQYSCDIVKVENRKRVVDPKLDQGMTFDEFNEYIGDMIKTYIKEDVNATQQARVKLQLFDLNRNHTRWSDRLRWRWYQLRLCLIRFWQWKIKVKKPQCFCAHDDDKYNDEHIRSTVKSSSIHSIKKNKSKENDGDSDNCSSDSGSSDSDDNNNNMFEISTNLIVSILVMLSVSIVLIDIYMYEGDSKVMQAIETTIVTLFVVEVLLRIIAFSLTGYLKNNFNKLDFVVSISLLVFDILLTKEFLTTVFLLRALRLVKVLRVMKAFDTFDDFFIATKAILSSFIGLFELAFCLIYIYVVIGCQIFGNLVTQEKLFDKCNNPDNYPNQSQKEEDFWCSMHDSLYYEINFNSFTHALVVLMTLIVVNNWHVITQMYVYASGSEAAKIYFVIVYFTSVVLMMNILQSFILDVFQTDYDTYKTIHKQLTRHERFDISDTALGRRNDDGTNRLQRIRIYNSFRAMTQHYTLKLMNQKSNGSGGGSLHGSGSSLHTSGINYNATSIPLSKASSNGPNSHTYSKSKRQGQSFVLDGYDTIHRGSFSESQMFNSQNRGHLVSEGVIRKYSGSSHQPSVMHMNSNSNAKLSLPKNGIFMPESQGLILVTKDDHDHDHETDDSKQLDDYNYWRDSSFPSKITDQIYLGSSASTNEKIVKELRITHILSCIGGMTINDEIKRLRVAMDDRGHSQLETDIFKRAFPWLTQAMSNKDNRILIHCSMGVNRSPTVTVGFLMHHLKYDLKKAHDFVLSHRESILIHDKYMSQLREFDLKLFGKYSTKPDQLPTTSSVMRAVFAEISKEKEEQEQEQAQGKDKETGKEQNDELVRFQI